MKKSDIFFITACIIIGVAMILSTTPMFEKKEASTTSNITATATNKSTTTKK